MRRSRSDSARHRRPLNKSRTMPTLAPNDCRQSRATPSVRRHNWAHRLTAVKDKPLAPATATRVRGSGWTNGFTRVRTKECLDIGGRRASDGRRRGAPGDELPSMSLRVPHRPSGRPALDESNAVRRAQLPSVIPAQAGLHYTGGTSALWIHAWAGMTDGAKPAWGFLVRSAAVPDLDPGSNPTQLCAHSDETAPSSW
jgi:hypothetical protein